MNRWEIIVELPAQRILQRYIHGWQTAIRLQPTAGLSVQDTIASLEVFPERCPHAPENKNFTDDIRELFHGRRQNIYRILFTVDKDKVHVLHVRHGARLPLGEMSESET